MALELECPACHAELVTAETLLAETVRCPKCAALLYLATAEKPVPELCDMELGPEPRIVYARPSQSALSAPATPIEIIGDSLGGMGAPKVEGVQ